MFDKLVTIFNYSLAIGFVSFWCVVVVHYLYQKFKEENNLLTLYIGLPALIIVFTALFYSWSLVY